MPYASLGTKQIHYTDFKPESGAAKETFILQVKVLRSVFTMLISMQYAWPWIEPKLLRSHIAQISGAKLQMYHLRYDRSRPIAVHRDRTKHRNVI